MNIPLGVVNQVVQTSPNVKSHLAREKMVLTFVFLLRPLIQIVSLPSWSQEKKKLKVLK